MARRILVVDDSATEQQAIRNPLVADGFHVVVASNGDEALQQLESDEFDLMVLDVIMPGKNGFQLARMIRNDVRWSKLPIVMVTSKDGAADRFWGLKQGATEYITKPFKSAELVDVVRKHS